MRKLPIVFAVAFTFSCPLALVADEVNQIFSKVNEYIAQKNYPKALEELQWAKQEIEKMNTGQLKSFFPDQLAGFTGGKLETNSALGFTAVERSYTKPGDAAKLKVSLTGGGGGAGAGALGGLAAFGKMAAMMGAQENGSETVRISGRTAQMTTDDSRKSAELTVFLDSGSILKFEMDNSADSGTLRQLAEAININGLDGYLKGQAPAPAARG